MIYRRATYRLVKECEHYRLEEFHPRQDNHSCYDCYDVSTWRRRNCPSNVDRWIFRAQGDLKWAVHAAAHYGVKLPQEA